MKPSFKYFPLVMSLLLNLNAHARVFFVNNTNDSTAATSLRGAIIAANNNTEQGKHDYLFGAPPQKHHVYRLTISGADEFVGLTGDLNVNRGNLFIEGYTTNVTIDATGLGDRVFQVSGAHLTLENLIITGGTAPTGSTNSFDGEFGGAIENLGTLFLDRCTITNNTSGEGQYIGENEPSTNSGDGGEGGPITIGGPPFEPLFGSGGGDGGGIFNFGTLEAKNCVFAGNVCGTGFDGGSGGDGGAIANNGTCLVMNCIISGNQSGDGGVPVENAFGAGGSGGTGGGIFNFNQGKMTLKHCVIDANASGQGVDGDFSGNGGNGGGIYNVGKLEIDFFDDIGKQLVKRGKMALLPVVVVVVVGWAVSAVVSLMAAS